MSRNLSSNLMDSVFDQETSEVFIILIEISHPDLSENIYISSDPTEDLSSGVRGTTSNGEEYIFIPFNLTIQEQTENLLARAKLTIDNIDRSIMLAIRTAANEPPRVDIKIVLASDPDTIEINIPRLKMNNIKADAFTIEAELQPVIIQGEQFPKDTFNQADFPGIFGV